MRSRHGFGRDAVSHPINALLEVRVLEFPFEPTPERALPLSEMARRSSLTARTSGHAARLAGLRCRPSM